MKRNLIFWFSGSGNSRYVARRIDSGFSGVRESRMVSMAQCVNSRTYEFALSEGDSVGFVFPTYFWGVPSVVRDFIERFQLKGFGPTNYVYQVLTCGGSTGTCDRMTSRLLRKRGYRLDAAFSVSMPDSYCILLDLMTPKDRIDPIMEGALQRLGVLLPALADLCSRGPQFPVPSVPVNTYHGQLLIDRGTAPARKTFLMYPLYRYGRSTAPFYSEDHCIGCGKCVSACPLEIISLKDSRPVWKKGKCVQCLSCLHSCPVEAIQYGKKTKGRLRYLFPEDKYRI